MSNNYFSNPYFMDTSFQGYYVNDYSEVLNMATPINGNAIIFVNLDKGKLWSKKLIQGQSYIQEYEIRALNSSGDNLLKRLEELENKIKELNGGQNVNDRTNVVDETKASKS